MLSDMKDLVRIGNRVVHVLQEENLTPFQSYIVAKFVVWYICNEHKIPEDYIESFEKALRQ